MKRAALELVLTLIIAFVLLAWATDEIGWAAIAAALAACKVTLLLVAAHFWTRHH